MKLFKSLLLFTLIAVVASAPISVLAQDGGDEEENDPLGGATEFATVEEETDVTFMLDYVPNTNHLGIYVAQEMGYFEEANLNVEIIEPADILPEAALQTGIVDFGVGFQDFSSLAMADGGGLVSIAAIIQHNTSGFATLASEHTLEGPADLVDLTYGGFSFPSLENPLLDLLASCDDTEWNDDNYLDIGFTDPIELMNRDRIDFAWIFYAWQGIAAELDGNDLSTVMLMDYTDCVPDYYTPILLTSAEMIDENPDVVRAFTHAVARGYAYAIENPEAAADLMLEAVPTLDEELVLASSLWLADEYQADAPRWGQQEAEIWEGFTQFLVDNDLIEGLEIDDVFTNEFLPGSVEVVEDEE